MSLTLHSLNRGERPAAAYLPNAITFYTPSPTRTDVFDPNHIKYDPQKIYNPQGELTLFQKACSYLIKHVYHPLTRGKFNLYQYSPIKIRCMFKEAGKLSCSEYTLVMIQEFGSLKGIWEGFKRIMRCNPINSLWLKNTTDPVFPVPSFQNPLKPAFPRIQYQGFGLT